jgi:hypothetical protein
MGTTSGQEISTGIPVCENQAAAETPWIPGDVCAIFSLFLEDSTLGLLLTDYLASEDPF